MGKIDDSIVMKKWVKAEQDKCVLELEGKIAKAVSVLGKKVATMQRENLVVPNLIGSSEKHKNLKEWIIAKTRNDRTILETVEKSVADSLADKI